MSIITIKENEKPKLMCMETICDNGLHEKLNKYELTRFLNKHSTNLIVGGAKQFIKKSTKEQGRGSI